MNPTPVFPGIERTGSSARTRTNSSTRTRTRTRASDAPASAAAPMADGPGAHQARRGARAAHWQAAAALALLWLGLVSSVAAALAFGMAAPRTVVDSELVALIRGMAVIKGGLALGAALGLSWWLGRVTSWAAGAPMKARVSGLGLAASMAGVWAMAAASVLVWQLSAVGSAALLFHTGEFTVLIAAWREAQRCRQPARASAAAAR